MTGRSPRWVLAAGAWVLAAACDGTDRQWQPLPDAGGPASSSAGPGDAGGSSSTSRGGGASSTSTSLAPAAPDAGLVPDPWQACLEPREPEPWPSRDGGSYSTVDAGCVTLTVRVLAGAYRGSADGTLTTARFNTPRGMTARGDEAFLADSRNHVVRRLDLGEGGVRVVAGQPGLSGWSDGPEDAARLNGPRAVAVVPGRLYIADEGNNAIRVLDLGSRVLSTLAGSPPTRGSADGVGTAATFNGPAAVVATRDGRTLYVADQYNHAVRSVDVFTREVATVAGSAGETGSADGVGPAARFNMPAALALSPGERNLYVADAYNHAIRQVDLGTRAVTTVAGLMTGPGTLDGVGRAAGFQYPSGLATDGRSLYVADRVNLRLRRVDLATWEVSTVVGKSGAQELVYGTSDVARLYPPLDVAVARERGVLLFTMDRVHAVAVVEGLPVRGVDAGAAGSPDGG